MLADAGTLNIAEVDEAAVDELVESLSLADVPVQHVLVNRPSCLLADDEREGEFALEPALI